METLTFRTTIKSSQDVGAVTLNLNTIEQVDGWAIETDSPDHLLTVQTTDNRIANLVVRAVEEAGFKAEPVAG